MLVLNFLAVATIVIHLITLAIELVTTHSTNDAHEVAKMITRGQFSRSFWLGMVLVGNVLPLLLLFTGGSFSFALAGILILAGMYIGERIWVKAPQLVPLS
jgi:formate-dependent nitrite reductase membrane component NrfD